MGEEQASLEELIKTVKLRMREEERQEQVSGEEEARRESERQWARRLARERRTDGGTRVDR